jgi:cytochrome b561
MTAPAPAETANRYTRMAIWLHWLVALAILGQVALGWYVDDIPRNTPARAWWVNFHKSIGLTLALLILFRLYWRWSHEPPALPLWMPGWRRFGANLSHWGLYACMVIMPLSGYIASNFSKWGVKYFNAIQLPPWGVDDKQIYAFFNGTHVVTSYVFVALIVVHVISALHHAMRRDGILQRMWPSITRGS